jgi:cysteine desulfurase/selenocysteine lyase
MTFNPDDFPQVKQAMYFDSAATALKPTVVIEAMKHFYSNEYGTVHRAIYRFASEATAKYSAVRKTVQKFLNAPSPETIVFTKGTTEAINLVASSFGEAFIKAGDEILISAAEHHSNIVPWQLLCQRTGALLKIIPLLPTGQLDLSAFETLLSPRTKLVAIAHISNVLGLQNPIASICISAHRVGAKVFVDGAQSAPHIPIDVQALGCDFFAFSGHKVYGPTGIGILYGKQELLDAMPPYQGGGDMIKEVSFEKTTYQLPPLKFEAGTPPIAAVIGLGAALEYLMQFDPQKLMRYEAALSHKIIDSLQTIDGIQIYGTTAHPRSLVTFNLPHIHPLDAATWLDVKGIALRSGHLCAQPLLKQLGCTSALRLSWAPYNTEEEVEKVCETIISMASSHSFC